MTGRELSLNFRVSRFFPLIPSACFISGLFGWWAWSTKHARDPWDQKWLQKERSPRSRIYSMLLKQTLRGRPKALMHVSLEAQLVSWQCSYKAKMKWNPSKTLVFLINPACVSFCLSAPLEKPLKTHKCQRYVLGNGLFDQRSRHFLAAIECLE